jgi:hypothetical protein
VKNGREAGVDGESVVDLRGQPMSAPASTTQQVTRARTADLPWNFCRVPLRHTSGTNSEPGLLEGDQNRWGAQRLDHQLVRVEQHRVQHVFNDRPPFFCSRYVPNLVKAEAR